MGNTVLPPSIPHPRSPADDERRERFEVLFRRTPTEAELDRFNQSHERLLMRLPGRVRRRAARIIATV